MREHEQFHVVAGRSGCARHDTSAELPIPGALRIPDPVSSASSRISPADDRPPLLFVAVDMGRHFGSEPGKSWAWACALARHYRLHVVTAPAVAERCRPEPLAADWSWHTTRASHPTSSGLTYYREYARWCRDATELIRRVVPQIRPVGLHHITLGSFRMLPRYDLCGLPYTLGPLGGGEATPWAFLSTARLPPGPWLSELVRPWLNRAAAIVPALRAVMRGSRLALGTTPETEQVLRRMGAKNTGVAFPDCLHADVDGRQAESLAQRAATLKQRVRLVWSGRAVWWKGGQLAVELLRRLVAAGIDAELTIFSHGHALPAWRRQMEANGLAARCRVNGFVARSDLLAELGRSHVFVFPTLHDSANSALLEAYAMGLPSLTVGLGGPAVIATEQTGYNVRARNLNTWLDGAAARVRAWQQEPSAWLAASEAARARAEHFRPAHIDACVDRWLPRAAFAS